MHVFMPHATSASPKTYPEQSDSNKIEQKIRRHPNDKRDRCPTRTYPVKNTPCPNSGSIPKSRFHPESLYNLKGIFPPCRLLLKLDQTRPNSSTNFASTSRTCRYPSGDAFVFSPQKPSETFITPSMTSWAGNNSSTIVSYQT